MRRITISWLTILLVLGVCEAAFAQTAQDYLPNENGNEWTYEVTGGSAADQGRFTTRIDRRQGGWAHVRGGILGDRWAWISGTSGRIWVWNRDTRSHHLALDLDDTVGSTFSPRGTGIPCWDGATFEIAGRDHTATTAVGTFRDCVVVTLRTNPCADAGVTRMVFAPGVGLVAYRRLTKAGTQTGALVHARVAGKEYDTGSGPAAGPITVAVVSDLNGSYGSTTYRSSVHAAVARIVALRPDLVLSTGDMVGGQRSGLDYVGMWSAFHAAVTDPLTRAGIPFAPTPGNHDASGYPAYQNERDVYETEWSVRAPAVTYLDRQHFPFRYAFTAGPALFISLDDTSVGPLGTEQMAWLRTQLTRGRDYPVKVVFGHVPLYPVAEGRETQVIGDPALEALLNEHDVSLFVAGHHHAYYPGKRGRLRLVSTGCLGSSPRRLIGQSERSERSILVFRISQSGITELDAFAGSTFERRIERSALPRSVGTSSRKIDRDDQP